MSRKISLITMGAGNVLVLKETLKSFSGVCDEIVYGDLLLFPDDRDVLKSYQNEFNLRIVEFPFNFIFKNGFSALLNELMFHGEHDLSIYMNTSEVISVDYGINKIVDENEDCNSFFFTHATDPHRWYRLGDKKDLKWSGRIHESLEGEFRPYHKPIFQMSDLPKDMGDEFKAKCFDTVKEIVYFKNYMSILDNPETIGATDPGWIKFVEENYDSFKERLENKGKAYQAFVEGDYEMLMKHFYDTRLDGERFESNIGIEYQHDRKYLL